MEHLAELLPVSLPALSAAIFVTFLAAAIQGTIGFGSAIVAVPILSLVDPHLAPVPQLIVGLLLALLTFLREREHADSSGVSWILIGQLPGAAIGIVLVKLGSARVLDALVGAIVIAAVLLLGLGLRLQRNGLTRLVVGAVSGVFGMVAATDGPPLALLYRDASGPTTRATLGAIFTVGIVITLATRTLAGEVSAPDLVVSAAMLPAMLLGLLASRPLARRVEGRPIRIATLIVCALAGAALLLRAGLGWLTN